MNTRAWVGTALALALTLGACDDDDFFVVVGDAPAPPVDVGGRYFNRSIVITWALHPDWDSDSFRVYGKRTSDPSHFLVAEVTNCSDGLCSYTDVNIVSETTYNYFVSAVDPDSGVETDSEISVDVFVPAAVPPPIPGACASWRWTVRRI